MATTEDRPIMTAAELASHKLGSHGRDYRLSDDGFDDMDVASKEGWVPVSGWGLDGWDLGDWPYVVISVRNHDSSKCDPICVHAGDTGSDFCRKYEMRQTVEGDTDVYSFDSQADRSAAIDYLFVWYGLGKEYDDWLAEGLSYDKRSALDAGALRVPARFRGAFSWARLDASKVAS